jgi:hypothetical protein
MVELDDGYFGEARQARSFKAAVASEHYAAAIDDQRICKAELTYACGELLYLLTRMRSWISWVGPKCLDRDPFDPKQTHRATILRSHSASSHFRLHDQQMITVMADSGANVPRH